jgi:hypothetical protein
MHESPLKADARERECVIEDADAETLSPRFTMLKKATFVRGAIPPPPLPPPRRQDIAAAAAVAAAAKIAAPMTASDRASPVGMSSELRPESLVSGQLSLHEADTTSRQGPTLEARQGPTWEEVPDGPTLEARHVQD